MKRTLVILRHAAAESFGIVASDFDRTLVPKGVLAAKQTAKKLLKAGFKPGWMAASSAPRALFTLRIAAMEMGLDPEQIHALPELYDGDYNTILKVIRSIPDSVTDAVICGHNPAVSEAAAALCSNAGTPCLATAEAVLLELDSDSWIGTADTVFCQFKAHFPTLDRR